MIAYIIREIFTDALCVPENIRAGDSRGPFIINLCSMWGIRVLSVVLFTHSYGVIGVWVSMTCELVFRGIVFLIRLLRGRWLSAPALT